MKRLENFIQAIQGIALFSGLYLEKYLEEHLLGPKSPAPFLVALCAFIGLVVLIKVSEAIAELSVQRWRSLRRMILGNNYIEGVWFNKVPVNPPLYGLVRIEIKDGSVTVEGEQYDQHGKSTATWHSEMSTFDGNILAYAYKATYGQHDKEHEAHGFSRISFGKASLTGLPTSYIGHFHDTAGNQEARCFTGLRVQDPIRRMLGVSLPEKAQGVKLLIAQVDKVA